MINLAYAVYGGCAYALFLATFLYAVGFVANLPLPKTVDSGEPGPVALAIATNLALLSLFAVQHSAMARPGFKRWWTRFVPEPVERATYVLLASLVLDLLYWKWQPVAGSAWQVANPVGAVALQAVLYCGWGLVFLSTCLLSHFELFGLRQVYSRLRGITRPEATFKTPSLYKQVRHPIYLGFLLAFWATPDMSYGHLLFALVTSAYILVGIQLEERDLVATFGDEYRAYRRQVPMLVPLGTRRTDATPDASDTKGLVP